METNKQIEAVEKEELVEKQESTKAGKWFVPKADIFEVNDELILKLDMPGVPKSNIEINLEKNVLSVKGEIETGVYDKLQPLYTEFNVGHYQRSFRISNEFAQDKIQAELKQGTLSITLPKREETLPRKIEIS